MTGLTPNTIYYARAYAVNSVGISYGDEVGFTTSINLPVVTTSPITDITRTTAIGGGNVTNDGGAAVTERGICWGTDHNPSISGSHLSNGMGIGVFTVDLTDLTENTVYFVRAYAKNSGGISYGNEQEFRTFSSGQWLYYDNGTYATSIGFGDGGGVIYWGSMFPAASLTGYAGTNLTKVALFENEYNISPVTVNIYLGGTTAPGTLVSTQNFTPVGGEAFHEVTLTTPVGIDGTQNLWITFNENGTYPANACEDTGEANNRWVSENGNEWADLASAGLFGYGWMIRGFLYFGDKGGRWISLENTPTTNNKVKGPTVIKTLIKSQ